MMMTIAKEVTLTTAGKVALLEVGLKQVRVINRLYDFRSRVKGYYTDIVSVMNDIQEQQEIKQRLRILEQQIATLKPFIGKEGLSLEEQLLINQAEIEMYKESLEIFKNEWESNAGDYKAMCYNQIEAINKRIAHLSKEESILVQRVIGHHIPEEAPAPVDEEVLLVDRNVLEGTLKQLGLCDTHMQHAINLMTVKAVG